MVRVASLKNEFIGLDFIRNKYSCLTAIIEQMLYEDP